MSASPLVHDYTRRHWGHDYTVLRVVDGGRRIRLAGWGQLGIAQGDFVILQAPGGSTQYQVESIAYEADPPDQFFAWAIFAPRRSSEAA
jgi:hypothetical protein